MMAQGEYAFATADWTYPLYLNLIQTHQEYREAVAHNEPYKILEVGCNDGELLCRLVENLTQQAEFTGIDVSSAALQEAKKKLEARTLRAKVEFAQLESYWPQFGFDFALSSYVAPYIALPTLLRKLDFLTPFNGRMAVLDRVYTAEEVEKMDTSVAGMVNTIRAIGQMYKEVGGVQFPYPKILSALLKAVLRARKQHVPGLFPTIYDHESYQGLHDIHRDNAQHVSSLEKVEEALEPYRQRDYDTKLHYYGSDFFMAVLTKPR